MTNKKFKGSIASGLTTVIVSEELTLNYPAGKNAYRIDAYKLQAAMDAEADNDEIKIQLAYEDLAGGAFFNY